MLGILLPDDGYYVGLWDRLEQAVEAKRSTGPSDCEGCQGCNAGNAPNPDANKDCSVSSRTKGHEGS